MERSRHRGRTRAAQPSDAGFTLIELLVVVIIIGILAAISIPVYSGVQRSAHKAAAQSWTTTATHMIYEYYLLNGVMPTTLTAAGVPAASSDLTTQFYSGTDSFNGPQFCVSAYWTGAPWTSGFGPTADTYKDVYPRTLTPVSPESYCVYYGG